MTIFVEFCLITLVACCASVAIYVGGRHVLKRAEIELCLARWGRRISSWSNYILVILVAGYVLVLGALSILKYNSANSGFDLAIFNQAIWNSLNGRLFESGTDLYYTRGNILGVHFSPLLLSLIPLYAVWSDTRTLLIVQTILLASAAIGLYWYARRLIGNTLALVLAFSWLLSPSLQYTNLYDFHEIALATGLLTFVLLFLLRRRYLPFLIVASLAVLVKEEIALIVAGLGLFVWLAQRRWRLGLGLFIFGILSFLFLVLYVIPSFGKGFTFATALYGSFGNTLSEVLVALVTQPDRVFQTLLVPVKIEFILHLLIPLGLLPLLGTEVFFLAFPTLGYFLLSDVPTRIPISPIRFHYTATLLPFMFFAAVLGLKRIQRFKLGEPGYAGEGETLARKLALIALILIASGTSYYLYAPGPFTRNFDATLYSPTKRDEIGQSIVDRIPREAIVVGQREWVPQLAGRAGLYDVDTIPDYMLADYAFADKRRGWYTIRQGVWEEWLSSGYFQVIDTTDDFILARQKNPENVLELKFGDDLTLLGYTVIATDTIRGGMHIYPMTWWHAEQDIPQDWTIQMQILDAQGHVWSEQTHGFMGNIPNGVWREGKLVGDRRTLYLPPTIPKGIYHIALGIQNGDGVWLDVRGKEPIPSLAHETQIGTLNVEKDKTSITASQLVQLQSLNALFADMEEMRLLGYAPLRQTISSSEIVHIGLYWRAREKPRMDYFVSVQLRDAHDQVVFEHSAQPAQGTYPTTEWAVGEVLLDWHDFVLPRNVVPGDYQIHVLLRKSENASALGQIKIGNISISQ